jgi:hypothetical protein
MEETNKQNNSTSEVVGAEISKEAPLTTSQNVHFIDGDEPWSYDIKASNDETTQLAGYQDAGLGSFLSRPVKIQQFQWTPGGSRLFQVFNPWADFFSNSDVLDKINRYRNLRCNLKIKVLINGNSFYYGRALMSYNPYVSRDQVTLNRAFFQQDLVQASQKPHILIDPTTSQGGEMTLPFIWPENYVDITEPDWADHLGRITIHDFDILQHANGGSDPISVVIFAWAENLTLAIPTTAAAQAGVEQGELDEFGFPKPYDKQARSKSNKITFKSDNTSSSGEFSPNGLVSKPASAVAKMASSMAMVPVMAPYAKATSLVAQGVSDLARLLGYSRPNSMEDPRVVTPRYMGNMANSDVAENLVKLSLDSKNELTVDTRVMGLGGEDEMTVASIANRMSFWRQFDWPEAAVTDTMLASFKVEPSYVQALSTGTGTEIHSTALAYAATPFDFWQGSIKFRFNVICSEYHRGRLRVVFNPKQIVGGAPPFNQTYSTTIDIAENRDFEYEVKWAEPRAWQFVRGIGEAATASIFNVATPVAPDGLYSNGTITVYVVNELATPSITAADVKVQIWVAAGDDFAVSSPTQKNLVKLSLFQPQADIAPALATSMDTSNAPCCAEEVKTFGAGDYIKDDNQYLVYQGERVKSFREVLRRYQYHNSYFPGAGGDSVKLITYNITDFPFSRGWEPGGQDLAKNSANVDTPYNFCSMLLVNYLTPAFACRRGSMRRKIIHFSPGFIHHAILSVTRNDPGGTGNNEIKTSLSNSKTSINRFALQKIGRNGISGTHTTPVAVNPCLEYETTFYTHGQRFVPGRLKELYNATELSHNVTLDIAGSTSMDKRLDAFVSVGEDFQLGMFVGAPILYSYEDPLGA